jgi:hypothetical protein
VVLSVKLDTDVVTTKLLRSNQGRTGPAERVKHNVTRLGEGFDELKESRVRVDFLARAPHAPNRQHPERAQFAGGLPLHTRCPFVMSICRTQEPLRARRRRGIRWRVI